MKTLKDLSGGVQLNIDNEFLVDEGRGDRIKTIKAGHNRPASKTPFKCFFAGGRIIIKHRILAW